MKFLHDHTDDVEVWEEDKFEEIEEAFSDNVGGFN